MQNFTALDLFRRLKETKMWQNRILGLDPDLNSPEKFGSAKAHKMFRISCFLRILTSAKYLLIFSALIKLWGKNVFHPKTLIQTTKH